MAYLDIQCETCGELHHQARQAPKVCPQCGTAQIVVAPHDFSIDERFREERENMLERMDVD